MSDADIGTTTKKRGRPVKNDFDRTLGLIGTVTGRKTSEIREEVMRRGSEAMIADLKANGIDIIAIKTNLSAKTA